MAILMAIGRFFKKIWDWIKQTAWIQPLLIVGLIFGAITSIRPIVNAINTKKEQKAEYQRFYENYALSLDGVADKNSEADKFTDALYSLIENGNAEEFRSIFEETCGKTCKDKFFVAYVAQDCEHCEEDKDAFNYFKNKLGSDFDMVTIFTDQGWVDSIKTEDVPFYQYCLNHSDFFEQVAGEAQEFAYKTNGGYSQSQVEDLMDPTNTDDAKSFYTPTILLVELTGENPGVTELMFGIEGDDKASRYSTLEDCWEHKNKFSFENSAQD